MNINRKELELLIESSRLSECLGCGKCTASCSFSELFGDLRYGRSPRGVIEAALGRVDLTSGDRIWSCPTCNECTDRCPRGVRIRYFLTGIRRLALAAGNTNHAVFCKQCGSYILSNVSHTNLVRQVVGEGESIPEFLLLCPHCRAVEHSRRVKEGFPGRLRSSASQSQGNGDASLAVG